MIGSNSRTISVLMAVYNEKEDFLKKSVESVLSQTFNDFEFIILDDCSTNENCRKILEKYKNTDGRIRVIRNEKNIGLTKSLNKGLDICEGKYVARIDSDDLADPHRLEKQLEFMENNPKFVLCGSWSLNINEKDEIIGEKKLYTDYKEIKKKLLYFNFFTHSSLFFRKDIAKEVGGYSEDVKKSQDYDFILKMSARYPIANIPLFLCYYRENPGSISANNKKKQEWYGLIARWRAIAKYGYPKIYFFKIIPAVVYFLFVPHFVEKIIFKILWQK